MAVATVNMKCKGNLNNEVKMSGSINMRFEKPNFANEWSEIYKATPGQRTEIDDMRSLGFARWIGLARKGKMIKVTKALAGKIENTHAANPNAFKTLDKPKQERSMNQIFSGKVELSILANWSDGYKYLVAGNTRLTAMMKIFGEGYVWQYNVPDELPRPGQRYFSGVR